jgi:hypothetical protein
MRAARIGNSALPGMPGSAKTSFTPPSTDGHSYATINQLLFGAKVISLSIDLTARLRRV